MKGSVILNGALIVLGLAAGAFAQGTPQARPPLFLSETWRALAVPPDDHGAWPASQQGVSNPNSPVSLPLETSSFFPAHAPRPECL